MEIYKKMQFHAAHQLHMDYESKCHNLHGHSWLVEVWINADELNRNSMVIDFSHIKEVVMQFDHRLINEILEEPTAEAIVEYILLELASKLDSDNESWHSIKTRVWETDTAYAEDMIINTHEPKEA